MTAGSARASARSKYTKNNQHWVSSSVRPFAMSSFAVASPVSLPSFSFRMRKKSERHASMPYRHASMPYTFLLLDWHAPRSALSHG